MSDYSDCWYDLHRDDIEKECKVQLYRDRMINELLLEEMIRIIFTDLIKRTGVSDVIMLGEKYLKE